MATKKKIGFTLTAKNNTKAAFDTVTKGLKTMGNAGKAVGKTLLAITAVAMAAATAFVALGKKSFESMDAIQKTADRIGMSAQMLQALQFGAVESGTEIEKLRLGMEKFTKQLGDASMGIGTAKPILEKYNISITDAAGELKSTEEVLLDVVDALGKTDSSFEKNAVLMALFGRTGAQLNALLGQGRDVLDEVIERYDRLGLAISKTTLNGVARANDKWQEFISIGRAVRDQFYGALAPGFTMIIDKLEKMALAFLEVEGGAEAFGRSMASTLVNSMGKGIEVLQDFGNSIAETMFNARLDLLNMQISLYDWLYVLSTTFLGARLGLDKFTEQFADAHDKLVLQWSGIQGTFTKPLDFSDTIKSVEGMAARILNPIEDIVVTAQRRGTELVSVWAKVLGSIKGATGSLTAQMNKSFTDFFDITSKKFMDFKNLALSVVSSIITEMTKMWVIQSFMPWLGGTGFGKFLGMAQGGTVTAGRPYLVGEKGAELFVPNQTGTIVPNDKMSGGGTNVNVNFNITAWDSKDATQAIAQQAPNIVSIVENSFRRRGKLLGAT